MSVYHGTKFGFVQSAVYDQMGVSLAGRLANASDINLCDAVSVGETAGIGVGLGVAVSALSGAIKPGINALELKLPTSSSTAADFAGILVRTDTGRTDADGNNYIGHKEIGTLLRANRVGGRIWIEAQDAITAGAPLHWVIADTAGTDKKIGGFVGTAVANDTVELKGIRVLTSAAAGELALVELGVEVDTTYTAGTGITISDDNVISAE